MAALRRALGHRTGGLDHKAALLHRPGQPLQERLVVVDQQQRRVGAKVELASVVHHLA